MAKITKAVLPVAGLGTRFLPVTKSVPKELLPLVDRPCLEYIVAEAVEAGLDEIIFVISRGKEAILDYFDRSPSLEASLEAAGKLDMAKEVRKVASYAKVVAVRQPETLGLGHAVACAAPATGDSDFAVLLGDDIIDSTIPGIAQLLSVHEERGGCEVALLEVPREHTDRYGICAGEMVSDSVMHVTSMVEKPKPEDAPSNLSIVGRYVLPARIHTILGSTPRGRGGEIQLTDALAVLAAEGSAWGVKFEGKRFDTGNFLGLLDATLHFAGKRPHMVNGLQELLAKYTLNTSNK
jgi:UTP--glucose-1-phosphate uridylyltransferase